MEERRSDRCIDEQVDISSYGLTYEWMNGLMDR